jgi:hypothetical protein
MIRHIASSLLPYSEAITLVLPSIVLFLIYSKENRFSRKLQRNTYLYSTLGVLFTFCGIWVGLDHFDPNNISSSLPGILYGFKSSFSSSICGMFGGILSSVFIEYHIEDEIDDPISSILITLRDILKSNIKIKESIESSVGENTKEVMFGFKNMSESSSEVLMEGLKEVIHKFDAKISGHLAESLTNLKESGEKMLEVITEEHSFHRQVKEDRESQMIAIKEMSENSIKAAEAFSGLISSYLRMEKNAEVASESFEQIGKLAHQARTSSRDMDSFMKTFSDQFSKVYSEEISKATEQQANYLISIVHHILKQIEESSEV